MTVYPIVTLSLDLFGFVIALILLITCLADRRADKAKPSTFPALLATLALALFVDAMAWCCEGHASVAVLALLAHTISHVLGYLTLLLLVRYLRQTLFYRNVAVQTITVLLTVLGVLATLGTLANWRYGFAFAIVDGRFVHGPYGLVLHLYPIFVLFCLALIILVAHGFSATKRLFYLVWVLLPLAGAILDIALPLSLSLIGNLVSVLLIYTGVYLQRRRTIEEQRNALMISQINPHFMYNTLTTLASLCDTSPAEAKALTIEFSSYLRRNLGALTKNELIAFEDELRHVGCYLKIERARFGKRLNVVYDIHDKDFCIPVLSVQPLVENAVKHGISKKKEGGTIRIVTHATAKHHVIEIVDNGVGFDAGTQWDNTHVGLENVRERLHSMCRGTLTLQSSKGEGTHVTVMIPKEKA